MPRSFLTKAGPRPEFAELYGAIALETESYPTRTEPNLFAVGATFWFGSLDTTGYRATVTANRRHQKVRYDPSSPPRPSPPRSHSRSRQEGPGTAFPPRSPHNRPPSRLKEMPHQQRRRFGNGVGC